MASSTKVDTDAVASEVYALVDAIKIQRAAGNTDGAAALNQEAETIISNNLVSRTAAVTKLKTTLRGAVAEAMKIEPTPAEPVNTDDAEITLGTDVALANAAEVAENDAEIDRLVAQGTELVRNIADNTLNGPMRIAQIQLDMRRRVLRNGAPDLEGQSGVSKNKAREIYSRVTDNLGEGTAADLVRKQVKKLQKDVQNAMIDIRVGYLLSLDGPGETAEAERALYPFVNPESELPVSEQVAAYYGFELKTKAQLAKERRDAKAVESASAESSAETEAGTTGSAADTSAAARIRRLVNRIEDSLSAAAMTEPEALRAEVEQMDESDRSQLAEEIAAQIEALQALASLIEA